MSESNRKGNSVGFVLPLVLLTGFAVFAQPVLADGSPSPEPAPSVSAKPLPPEPAPPASPEPTNADLMKVIVEGKADTDKKIEVLDKRVGAIERRLASGGSSSSSGSGVGRPRRQRTSNPHACSGPQSSEDDCDGTGGRGRSSACGCTPSAPPPLAPARCAPRISERLLAEIQRPAVVEQTSAYATITFHCNGHTRSEAALIPPGATLDTAVIWHEAKRRGQGPQFSHGHNMLGTMVCHHDTRKPDCGACYSKNLKDGMRQAAWIQGGVALTGIALYNHLVGRGATETTTVRNVGGTTTTTTTRGRGAFGNP